MSIKQFALDYISLFLLLVLTVDALYADWTLNPIYARIQLNLFQNSHAISILAVCASAYWMAFIKKDGMAVAVFAAFGTAAIHELALDAVDLSVFQMSSGLSVGYAVYLFAFLGIGFFISRPYHKRVWLVIFLMMMIWFLVNSMLPVGTTIDPLHPFEPTPDFYNPVTNIAEVASWIAPVSLWFLPRKWFLRQAR